MNEQYDKVYHVGSKKKFFDFDLMEMWQYRDLYVMYIKRDMVTYYKQTIFGPLWYIVQPLLMTLMYMLIFGKMAGIPTDGIPQPLFYLSGIALWNYFNQCFMACSNTFSVNQYVFSKVYFPRMVVPLASCTSTLIRLVIQIGIFIVAFIGYVVFQDFHPDVGWSVLFAPVIILLVGLHAMAWGLFFTSWSVKYRDLQYMIQFILQLGMYATPVIYPLSFMPGNYRWIVNLNPLVPLFEAFRKCCLGVGTLAVGELVYSVVFLMVTLALSVIVFNKKNQDFVDVI